MALKQVRGGIADRNQLLEAETGQMFQEWYGFPATALGHLGHFLARYVVEGSV